MKESGFPVSVIANSLVIVIYIDVFMCFKFQTVNLNEVELITTGSYSRFLGRADVFPSKFD